MKQEVRHALDYCRENKIDTFARWVTSAALCQEYQRRSGENPEIVDWRVVDVPPSAWNISAAVLLQQWMYIKTRGGGTRVEAFGLASFQAYDRRLLVTVGNTLLEAYK